jgi:hypothetical protein
MLEDIIVYVDSWEYPIDFVVPRTKNKLSGYPLFLARPWLSIVDAYISCRQGGMIIENGLLKKHLKDFPLEKLSTDLEDSF